MGRMDKIMGMRYSFFGFEFAYKSLVNLQSDFVMDQSHYSCVMEESMNQYGGCHLHLQQ